MSFVETNGMLMTAQARPKFHSISVQLMCV